jgi:hypothetical protein
MIVQGNVNFMKRVWDKQRHFLKYKSMILMFLQFFSTCPKTFRKQLHPIEVDDLITEKSFTTLESFWSTLDTQDEWNFVLVNI